MLPSFFISTAQNTMKTFALFLLMAVATCTAQQWKEINLSKPWQAGLLSVAVLDSAHAVCVGRGGVVRTTTDGGSSWSLLTIAEGRDFRSVCVLPPSGYIAVGDSGIIFRSIDFGVSWQQISVEIKQSLYSIDGINGAYVVVGQNATVLRSEDSGLTWQPVVMPLKSMLYAVHSVGNNVVVCVGENGAILRSQDSGKTWNSVTSPVTSALWCITPPLIDGLLFAAGDRGTILRSANVGMSWDTVSSDTSVSIRSLYFRPNKGLIALAANAQGDCFAVTSLDSGQTWSSKSRLLEQTSNGSVSNDEMLEIRAGLKGSIVVNYRDDSGTWKNRLAYSGGTAYIHRILRSGKKIFAFGSCAAYFSPDKNQIYHPVVFVSQDDGIVWNYHILSDTIDVQWGAFDADSPDSSTIIVGGNKGMLLYSSDGGVSWRTQRLPDKESISDIDFYDHNNGIITLQADNLAYRTQDGGQHWQRLNLPPSTLPRFIKLAAWRTADNVMLHIITFITDEMVKKSLLFSTDKGITWMDSTAVQYEFTEIYFANDIRGCAVTNRRIAGIEYANIGVTTDNGGKIWTTTFDQEFPKRREPLLKSQIGDNNVVTGITREGRIQYSADWGMTWKSVLPMINDPNVAFLDCMFIHPGTIIGVGTFGRLFRSDDAVSITGIQEEKDITAVLYPNPAQGRLILKVPSNTPTKLTVCTLSGESVIRMTLSGSTEYVLDISSLTTGLYVCYAEQQQGTYTRLIAIIH